MAIENFNVYSVYLCFESIGGSAWVRNLVLSGVGKDVQ